MPPCNCHPPFPRPEPFSPLPRPGKVPDWGKWIRDRLAEKGALLVFPTRASFPEEGAWPNLYLDRETGAVYRWENRTGYVVLVDPREGDDVLVYDSVAAFPDEGEQGKLYIAANTGSLYRWGGEGYVALLPGKADKAVPQTAGNFAALAADGNLADSGKKPADFATAAQGAKADTAVQSIAVGASTVEPGEGGVLALPVSSSATSSSETTIATSKAVKTVDDKVVGIEGKIPSQASASNQLADKAFVNSSIATETATFRGTFNLVTDLQLPLDATHVQVAQAIREALVAAGVDPDDNDYAFVQIPQDLEHTDAMKQVDRYKCTVVGSSQTWAYEWSLNNSSFTAAQWAAINSGITSGAVAKLGALPTAAELAQALAGKMPSTATGADIAVSGTDATKINAALAGKASKSDVDPLLFAQYYPDGSVKSASEFTSGIKYDSPDTTNRTITVKPFCNTGDSDNDNSNLSGRVVIPPFVDAQGNPYISDDGTRYKVVGVSPGAPEGSNQNLTAIVAPNTVTNIGYYAFGGCSALTSVSLPAATSIGYYAFYGCTSLTSIDFGDTPRSDVPLLGEDAFDYVPTACKIIVPYTQYDEWKAASGWSSLPQEFVRHPEKADKPATFTTGNLAKFDSNGNPTDSGKKAGDFATAAQGTKADTAIQGVKVNGTALTPDANKAVNVQVPSAGSALPLIAGVSDAGSSANFSREDHVHPAETEVLPPGYALPASAFPVSIYGQSASDPADIELFDATAGSGYVSWLNPFYGEVIAMKMSWQGQSDRALAAFNKSSGAFINGDDALSFNGNSGVEGVSPVLTARDSTVIVRGIEVASRVANATTGNLAALDADGNPVDAQIPAANVAVKGNIPYDLGTPIVINTASSETVEGETVNYGAATLADRTANIVQVTAATALDELRITFPAATSGKVRDFGLRVEIGTGSAALTAPALVPIAPTGETIKIENADRTIPALADGTATTKGVTLLYFSENAPGVFVVKGEQVEEVA